MTALLPRFALRMLLPLAGVAAMVAMSEPLPVPAPQPMELIGEEFRSTASAVRKEAERVREESGEAAERARDTAQAMRWLITLPAASASGRRCLVDTCAQ